MYVFGGWGPGLFPAQQPCLRPHPQGNLGGRLYLPQAPQPQAASGQTGLSSSRNGQSRRPRLQHRVQHTGFRHRRTAVHVAAVEPTELTSIIATDSEALHVEGQLNGHASIGRNGETSDLTFADQGSSSQEGVAGQSEGNLHSRSPFGGEENAENRPKYKKDIPWDAEKEAAYREAKRRFREVLPPKELAVEPVLPEHVWFRTGDIVVGRIIWTNPFGAKVELLQDTRIVGYVPDKMRPYYCARTAAGAGETLQKGGFEPAMPEGLVREFRVTAVPSDMVFYGRGPMLSAKSTDIEVIWNRLNQMKEACDLEAATYMVRIHGANAGGLLTEIQGLPAFIPYNRMAKAEGDWLTPESAQHLLGQQLEVIIDELSRPSGQEAGERFRIILNASKAKDISSLRALKVGAVIDGSVRRVESYGCFIGVDNTRVSGLMHVSNISRARVESVSAIFKVGDRVRALIIGMDSNYTRISLSTAELEERDGDMLLDPAMVYAKADESAKVFNDHLAELMMMDEERGNADSNERQPDSSNSSSSSRDSLQW